MKISHCLWKSSTQCSFLITDSFFWVDFLISYIFELVWVSHSLRRWKVNGWWSSCNFVYWGLIPTTCLPHWKSTSYFMRATGIECEKEVVTQGVWGKNLVFQGFRLSSKQIATLFSVSFFSFLYSQPLTLIYSSQSDFSFHWIFLEILFWPLCILT